MRGQRGGAVAHRLERPVVGDGIIGRHAAGGDVDKDHNPGLELVRDWRVHMAQRLGHGLEDAVVAVHTPVGHRHRVDACRAGAAEDLQLERKRQAGVRVGRSWVSCGGAIIGCGHPEAGALELELPERVVERFGAFLLAVVALAQIASANPLGDLACVYQDSDRSVVQVGRWRFASHSCRQAMQCTRRASASSGAACCSIAGFTRRRLLYQKRL